jgi:3-deoxy-D-manno-octulosonate 8-phosphate phosphatase (KDO 8-P phosphatase)
MVIMDVDGVLSDGRIIYDARGIEYKCFDAHDGYGISRAREKGLILALITGRNSKVVRLRARALGIKEVHQGIVDKVAAFNAIKQKYGVTSRECCYIGDDEFDLPLLRAVGFSAAPGDAVAIVRKNVDYVTTAAGGRGAVREVLDLILRAKKLI